MFELILVYNFAARSHLVQVSSRGRTITSLKSSGNCPDDREELNSSVRNGASVDVNDFRNFTGKITRSQDFAAADSMRLMT